MDSNGLVTCDDCVWLDECSDSKPDGWCEDFCLSPVKRVVVQRKEIVVDKDKPIDCKTCKKFMSLSEDYCSGVSDIYFCRKYVEKKV